MLMLNMKQLSTTHRRQESILIEGEAENERCSCLIPNIIKISEAFSTTYLAIRLLKSLNDCARHYRTPICDVEIYSS